jgi:hypothetical protein
MGVGVGVRGHAQVERPGRPGDSAERAYQTLEGRGYRTDDLNVLMSDKTRKKYFDDKSTAKTELGNKALEGAGVGAVTGGVIAAVVGAATIAIPGVGLVVAGPLAAALAGAGAGSVAGGAIGALVGAGIPEERARLYQTGLSEGGIVLGVKPRSDDDADYFEREWKNSHGEHVYGRRGY